MRRESVVVGEVDAGEVGEDKVAAFGFGVLIGSSLAIAIRFDRGRKRRMYRQPQLVKHSTESLHFSLHILPALIPKPELLRPLETYGGGFLQYRDAAEADAGVGCGDVVDKICGAHEISDAPAGAVEVLAGRPDGDGLGGDFGGEGGHAGERGIGEAVVNLRTSDKLHRSCRMSEEVMYLVGEDEDIVFDAKVGDCLKLGFGKDLAYRIVA